MRLAIVYNEKDIWLEFTPEKFVELFETYYEETKSIPKAMERIVNDIKRETQRN